MAGSQRGKVTAHLSIGLAVLVLGFWSGAAAVQGADAAREATIGENQLWRALLPDAPTDPNNPSNTGDSDAGVSPENPLARRYHWSYSRTDPRTGLPLQIPEGDARLLEIDAYRIQCIRLVSQYYDQDGLSVHIPVSQFDNLEDQAVEMVLGCVNNLHLKRERWLQGVGAIVCEAHTNHCWGPNDIWTKGRPAFTR